MQWMEVYDDQGDERRLIPEFWEFIRAINQRDHVFCEKMLEESVAVCVRRLMKSYFANFPHHFGVLNHEKSIL